MADEMELVAHRRTVEQLARAALEEVRDCLDFAAGGGRVHPARWHELAERLRAIERAMHGGG